MAQPPVTRADMPRTRWLRAVFFTGMLVLLVAVGVTESINHRTAVVVLGVFGAAGAFLWMFPGSRFFVLAFANAMSVYTCIFFYLAETNFPGLDEPVFAIGYLLPTASFLAGAWWWRAEIRGISQARHGPQGRRPMRVFAWLLPVAVLAAGTHAAPRVADLPGATDALFVTAMAATAVFVMVVSRDVCIFLIDTGSLFDRFFARIVRLVAPVFAFLTLYSLNVIVFAMIYRIMDRLASTPLFTIDGEPARISFVDGLYFSVVTLSTVGYGDIVPASDPVRVVAAVEIVLGVVLILFGFFEIIRHARTAEDGRSDRPHV